MAPQARVIVVEDVLPADDSRAWAAYTREVLGYAPDLVFTSETYGDAYARFLGARHVLVDLERRTVPVSASMIRRDPLAHWEHLEPCVRAHFARRVCVLGAESSGTTTLARALAAHYRTAWVPEFGREYFEAKRHLPGPMSWEQEEFEFIAAAAEPPRGCSGAPLRSAARLRHRLVRDPPLAGALPGVHLPGGRRAAAGRRMDLYLLTDCGIPFVQDGTRDGEHLRERMQRRFEEELRAPANPLPRDAGVARAAQRCRSPAAARRLSRRGSDAGAGTAKRSAGAVRTLTVRRAGRRHWNGEPITWNTRYPRRRRTPTPRGRSSASTSPTSTAGRRPTAQPRRPARRALDEKLRQAYFWIVNHAIISPLLRHRVQRRARRSSYPFGDSQTRLTLPSRPELLELRAAAAAEPRGARAAACSSAARGAARPRARS